MRKAASDMGASPTEHWSLAINGEGLATDQASNTQTTQIPNESWNWIHATLEQDFASIGDVEDHISELMVTDQTRPRFASYPRGALLILRGVGHRDALSKDDLVSVRLWIEPERVISFVQKPVGAISEIAAQYELNRGPASPAEFIAELAQRLVENMADVMAGIEADITELETESVSSPASDVHERIAKTRLSIIPVRRYLAPQREALSQMLATRLEWLNEESRHRLRDALDVTIRYIEDLDEARDQLEVIQTTLAMQIAGRTNRAMLVLAVVAAIFLPLSLITGLLGINVTYIPLSDHPAAFWGVCLLLLLLGAILVWLVRRANWL